MGKKRPREPSSSSSDSSSDSSSEEEVRPSKRTRLQVSSGYYAIPISVGAASPCTKYLFAKEHVDKTSRVRKGKTLFVTNLAYDCTKEDLRNIFSTLGEVADVTFDSLLKPSARGGRNKKIIVGTPDARQQMVLEEKKRVTAKADEVREKMSKEPFERCGFALVEFTQSSSLKKLSSIAPTEFEGLREEGTADKGLKLWLTEYKQKSNLRADALQAQVDQSLRDFDEEKMQREKRIEDLTNTADDDGWVTVTRKKGRKKTEGKAGVKMGAASLGPADLRRMAAKAQAKTNADFYRFQKTANRDQYIKTLKTRFAEDQHRLAKLKQGRKFKPFS